MTPPADIVLIIGEGTESEIPESVKSALRQEGIAFHLADGATGADTLHAWLEEDAPPAAVLVMEDVEDPIVVARRVHHLVPLVQIVFLARAERATELWRHMAGAPRIGNHFTIVDPEQAHLPRLLEDAVRVTRQRYKLTTTIDRINLRRQQPPPATDSITYRRLVVSDRYLASVLEHAGDAILALDRHGRITSWNRGAVGLFGHDEVAALEHTFDLLFADDRRSELLDLVHNARTGRAETRDDLVGVRADGTRFDAAVTAAPMRNEEGGIESVVLIARDITQQKRTKADLVAANERLGEALQSLEARRQELLDLNATLEERVSERSLQVRQLASEITVAEARERGRIARLLHDDLQQQLHVMQFQLEELREFKRAGLDDEFEEVLAEAAQAVKDATATTRNLTGELSPIVLQSEDFLAVLQWLAERFHDQYGLTVDVDAPGDVRFSHDALRDLLFSLVRECLFNVVKHAGAERAHVRLRRSDGHLELDVVDDGCGFDASRIRDPSDEATGFGLWSASQRLELFDATLHIDSEPGRGTCVTVKIPAAVLGGGTETEV